ncbi:PHD finger protein 12, partial [Elysia marginata]
GKGTAIIVQPKDDDCESTSSKSSGKSSRGKRQVHTTGTETESEHPLRTLVKAARYMNPLQFDVGKEIACNVPLPGSSKRMYGKAVRNQPKKQAHELDNGMVPLPAKTCFACNKSCRVAPLIQCDYCPLLFHLDCLNPPLTSLPTGRWMCPNHVEHFLDSHLLKSQSLTERLKLWDRYTNLVDSHTVKLDFLNKVHRKHPMFRFKRKLPSRPTISVPPAIKHFYENPTVLLPDPPRPGPPSTNPISELPGNRGTYIASLDEQEEWLSSVVSMQGSIAKYLAQKQIQKSSDGLRLSDLTPIIGKPTASVAPVMQREPDSTLTGLSLPSEDGQKSSPHLSSSSSSSSSTNTAIESPDCDTNCRQQMSTPGPLLNGDQKLVCTNSIGASMDNKYNGSSRTLDTPLRGAVSLLPSNLNNISNSSGSNSISGSNFSTLNGEVDMELDSQPVNNNVQGYPPSARVRSNSVDSPPSPLTPGVWGDAENASVNGSSKNIYNALNKSSVVAKVLSGIPQTAKVVLPSTKPILTSNTNNTSQRLGLQPSSKVQPSALQTPGTVSKGSSSISTGRMLIQSNKTNAINNIVGSSPTIANLNSMLQQWIEGNAVEGEFSKIDEQLTQILAWQRLQQLLPSAKATVSHSSNSTSVSAAVLNSSSVASGKKGLLNVYLSQQTGTTEVRSRAVLCPLSGKGQAIPMPYRSLTLGTGADKDVNLSDYGFCNFISGQHATIFYDEMSRHFELLNYSEHGTTVDNVLYSCDFSDKPATTPQLSPTVASVREIISKVGDSNTASKSSNSTKKAKLKRNKELQEDSEDRKTKHYSTTPRMSSRAHEVYKPCSCRASSSTLIGGSGAGWEGTALLHHGSYIKVGCLQFVFSIVDHAPEKPRKGDFNSVSSSMTPGNRVESPTPLLHHYHPQDSVHYHLDLQQQQQPISMPSYVGPSTSGSKFSNMPLLSTSQYLHNQPHAQQPNHPMSLLKTHLKLNAPP